MEVHIPTELKSLESELRGIIREHHKVLQKLTSSQGPKQKLELQKELEFLQQEIINVAYKQKEVTEQLRQSLLNSQNNNNNCAVVNGQGPTLNGGTSSSDKSTNNAAVDKGSHGQSQSVVVPTKGMGVHMNNNNGNNQTNGCAQTVQASVIISSPQSAETPVIVRGGSPPKSVITSTRSSTDANDVPHNGSSSSSTSSSSPSSSLLSSGSCVSSSTPSSSNAILPNQISVTSSGHMVANMLPFTMATSVPTALSANTISTITSSANVITTLPNGSQNLKLANGKPALFIIKVPQGQNVQPGQPINIVVPAQLNNTILQQQQHQQQLHQMQQQVDSSTSAKASIPIALPLTTGSSPIITHVVAQNAAAATTSIPTLGFAPSSCATTLNLIAQNLPPGTSIQPANTNVLSSTSNGTLTAPAVAPLKKSLKSKGSGSRSPTPTKIVKLNESSLARASASQMGSDKAFGGMEDKQTWFLSHLGLCSKQKIAELEKKKTERRRRKTANPQFSSAALEEKRRLNELLSVNRRQRGKPKVVIPDGVTKAEFKEKLEAQTDRLHKERDELLVKHAKVKARLAEERGKTSELEEQQRSVEENLEKLKSFVCFMMEGAASQGLGMGGIRDVNNGLLPSSITTPSPIQGTSSAISSPPTSISPVPGSPNPSCPPSSSNHIIVNS